MLPSAFPLPHSHPIIRLVSYVCRDTTRKYTLVCSLVRLSTRYLQTGAMPTPRRYAPAGQTSDDGGIEYRVK